MILSSVITRFFDGLVGVLLNKNHSHAQRIRRYRSLKSGDSDFQEEEMNSIK